MTQYGFYFDSTRCTGCRTCMNVCPVHAITIPKIV